jgi:hypothetical protein
MAPAPRQIRHRKEEKKAETAKRVGWVHVNRCGTEVTQQTIYQVAGEHPAVASLKTIGAGARNNHGDGDVGERHVALVSRIFAVASPSSVLRC